VAVVVGVVASEQHASLVAADDQVVCADGLVWWELAEVLVVELGVVAPSKDVTLGVVCQNDGFVQTGGDLLSLCGVAGLVDRVH